MRISYLLVSSFLFFFNAPCISMGKEDTPNDESRYLSYGGAEGHKIFTEDREKIIPQIAATIPQYIKWAACAQGRTLATCYQKHILDVGTRRRSTAEKTETIYAEQFGLPREEQDQIYHTPTNASKFSVLKQISINSLSTLLTPLIQTEERELSLEDDFSITTLKIFTPDQWPIVVYNETLKKAALFKKGQKEFSPDYEKVAFYTTFQKLCDVLWKDTGNEYYQQVQKTVKKLIDENPLMNWKDRSQEAMENYRVSLKNKDQSLSLLEMSVSLKDGQGDIPLTKTYCFIPAFPKESPNGITQNSLELLQTGFLPPLLEHTSRFQFPRLNALTAKLWEKCILLDSKSPESFVEALTKFSFVFFHKMLFIRGSASVGEWELEGFCLYHYRNKTFPNILKSPLGITKLDQVVLGSQSYSKYFEYFKNNVKITSTD